MCVFVYIAERLTPARDDLSGCLSWIERIVSRFSVAVFHILLFALEIDPPLIVLRGDSSDLLFLLNLLISFICIPTPH